MQLSVKIVALTLTKFIRKIYDYDKSPGKTWPVQFDQSVQVYKQEQVSQIITWAFEPNMEKPSQLKMVITSMNRLNLAVKRNCLNATVFNLSGKMYNQI